MVWQGATAKPRTSLGQGPRKLVQAWASPVQGVASLDIVRARMVQAWTRSGQAWARWVQAWARPVEGWEGLFLVRASVGNVGAGLVQGGARVGKVVQGLGLARTCPGKVQHCPKTSPPYQNENRPLHLRSYGCSHSNTSPHTCWGFREAVAPPGPPGRARTRLQTKNSMKNRVGVQKS